MDLTRQSFWVVDVEGNGATPPEIVELAIVEVRDLVLQQRRMDWLIKPQESIASRVTRIHGISDGDVAGAPEIDEIADDVMTWTHNQKIIGHNVKVEVDAITHAIPSWRPAMAVDTLRLARLALPGRVSYSLENLGVETGLDKVAAIESGKQHHSALFDSTLTGLLFIRLMSELSEQERESALRNCDILNSSQGELPL